MYTDLGCFGFQRCLMGQLFRRGFGVLSRAIKISVRPLCMGYFLLFLHLKREPLYLLWALPVFTPKKMRIFQT